MSETIISLAVFVALIAISVGAVIIVVRRDGRNLGDLIKQLVIWVAISALLPLTSYAGATMLHPQTRLKDLSAQQARVQQETYDTNDVAARQKSRDQAESLRVQIEDEQRASYQAMFWVSFPIGFISLIAGCLLRVVSVGTSLAFGGLCTLTAGCYSYWNDMGDALRFFSLLVVLVVVLVIGVVKFGRPTTSRAADLGQA